MLWRTVMAFSKPTSKYFRFDRHFVSVRLDQLSHDTLASAAAAAKTGPQVSPNGYNGSVEKGKSEGKGR